MKNMKADFLCRYWKSTKRMFLGFSLLSGLTSCETVVDIDLPEHKPALVVNSTLISDSLIKVGITHSLSSLDNGTIKPLNNALVTLYENNNFIENLVLMADGIYSATSKTAVAGNTYELKVSAPGYENVTAHTTIPFHVPVKSFVYDTTRINTYGYPEHTLNIIFNDPPGKNYYAVEVYEVFFDPNFGTSVSSYFLSSEDPALGETGSGTTLLLEDEIFDGKSYNLSIDLNQYGYYPEGAPQGTSEIYLNFKSVNKDYYLYKKTYTINSQNQGNPFSEPVQVYNNINNGFGIFGAETGNWIKIK